MTRKGKWYSKGYGISNKDIISFPERIQSRSTERYCLNILSPKEISDSRLPLLWSNQKIILKILIRKIINLHNSTHKDCFNIRKCWLFSYSFLCCQREVSTRFASLLYFCHGGRIGISCWYFNSSVRLKRFNSWNWLSGALTVKKCCSRSRLDSLHRKSIHIINILKIPHYLKY